MTTMTVTTARVHRYHLGFRLIHTVYRLMPMATAIGSNRPSGAGVCLTSTKPNFNNRNTKRSVSISRKHDLLYRENAHIFVSLSFFFLFTGSHCFCYGSTSSPGDCLYYYNSFVLPSLFLSKILTHFCFSLTSLFLDYYQKLLYCYIVPIDYWNWLYSSRLSLCVRIAFQYFCKARSATD